MELRETFVKLFTDAAMDKPSRNSVIVKDGKWVLTIKGNREKWQEMMQAACVPSIAQQVIDGDTLTVTWESLADSIFGENGMIAQRLGDYEVRHPQIHMARLVQRAIEMGEPAIIEAGTGTGKSYAYAAIGMAMNKKIIISTSNKALQAQLYQKDIPFLCELFPGKKVAVAQGKSNYLCRAKCQESNPQIVKITDSIVKLERRIKILKDSFYGKAYSDQSQREIDKREIDVAEHELTNARSEATKITRQAKTLITDNALISFYVRTETGNVEELEFSVKDLDKWTADDECTGKHCPFYGHCFYYDAKAKRNSADVIICNHALLVLDQVVPNVLPGADIVVVDEAHKLTEYARNALGQEYTLNSISKTLAMAFEHTNDTALGEKYLQLYRDEITNYLHGTNDREIGIATPTEFEKGQRLASELYEIADNIWLAEDTPCNGEEIRLMKRSQRVRKLADKIRIASNKTIDGYVRWIERETENIVCAPYDVSSFIGSMAGFETSVHHVDNRGECARCGRILTADAVHVLDGKAYGPDCIRHVDLFGDAEVMPLNEWLNQEDEITVKHDPTSIIFTSATIAAPSLSHFMRETGVQHGFQMLAESPFDYQNSALLYIPNGETPTPDSGEYLSYLTNALRSLVIASKGGAFLLFTSYRNMQHAASTLRDTFKRNGLTCFVQGELPKGEIIKQFKADGNAVLFATKSFWEGVSIDGAALRLVVIDKMPFAAPSPLSKARETTVKNPFIEMHVPEMIIDLKQGSGRLIRKTTDYGVIAILDTRIRLKPYGRSMVLPALPPAPLVSSLDAVSEFFNDRRRAANVVPTRLDQIDLDMPIELAF